MSAGGVRADLLSASAQIVEAATAVRVALGHLSAGRVQLRAALEGSSHLAVLDQQLTEVALTLSATGELLGAVAGAVTQHAGTL